MTGFHAHPSRSEKRRRLSDRDQELYNLLLQAANGSVDSRILIDNPDTGTQVVYDSDKVFEAFAMGYRGTIGQLLEQVKKRGGKLREYKSAKIMDCPVFDKPVE